MLQWLERAAARLNLFARRGPAEAQALSAQSDTLKRQSLVALARNESTVDIESSLEEVQLHRAASEVAWHERRAAGTLRELTVDDLRQELERWVAARPGPVHYSRQYHQQDGDSAGAGSGNLHS
jgi:ABC-type enterochelin transport system substrate-binding protein